MPHYHFDAHRRALGWLGGFVLTVGIVGLIAGGVSTQHAIKTALRQRDGRLAARSLARMVVPSDYVRFTAGCGWYRCYRVGRNIGSVAMDVHAVVASTGATFGLQGDPGTECDRNIPATARGCHDAGEVHHRAVLVFLRPVIPPGSTRRQVFRRTEVDVSFSPSLGD